MSSDDICIDQDECTSCGACFPVCPEDAITEDDGIYCIDQEKCGTGVRCLVQTGDYQCVLVCEPDAIKRVSSGTCGDCSSGDVIAVDPPPVS